MGSLAYAVGGGLAGAGQGLAAIGAEATRRITQEGLMRLQNQYAQERQQAGFGEEEKLQSKQQTFQKEQTEKELTARGGIARAEMAQKEKLAGQHEAGATERTRIIANSRLGVQNLKNDAAKKPQGPKPWQVKNVSVTTPINGVPTTTSKPLLFNPNNNSLYAPVGDKLIRWDTSTNAPAVDPKSFARTPIDPQELSRLYADPNGVIPGGFKGSGMTNAENFERLHHFLPAQLGSHLTQGGMVNQNNAPATGGGAESNSELEDSQDAAAAEGDTEYHNTGDIGPQASDNAPAQ